eukprot:2671121-Prymnesium_polylepis.1
MMRTCTHTQRPGDTRRLVPMGHPGLAFERSHTVHTFVLTPQYLKCSPVLTPHYGQVFTHSVLTS